MNDMPKWILPSWWFRRRPGAVIFTTMVILGVAGLLFWVLYYDWEHAGL